MKKIYLVISAEGEWEDYRENVEKAFLNKKRAKKFAKKIDESHKYVPVFSDDLWNEVLLAFDDFCEANKDYIKFDDKISLEERDKEYERLEKLENELYLKILHDKGYIQYKMIDVIKHLEYEENKFKHYFDCEIKEIELDDEED